MSPILKSRFFQVLDPSTPSSYWTFSLHLRQKSLKDRLLRRYSLLIPPGSPFSTQELLLKLSKMVQTYSLRN